MIKHAFTLIELLIVVAIIAILAAIAVPNFLEAQTRSKVSRIQTDLRSIVTGLEAYCVDNQQYPGMPPQGACNMMSTGIKQLTTPVAYLMTYPLDIFYFKKEKMQPIQYQICNYGMPVWEVWSVGPDKTNNYGALPYDPTNGTISDGDLRRANTQQEIPAQ
ncbi:MAG: prepilin-type N-terminal cleavage/methylation domain-containing protein [Candidatus Sumerlaeia bacterium]